MALGLGLITPIRSQGSPADLVHRVLTRNSEIRLSIEFHDRYSSPGLWFKAAETFCLSRSGEKNRDCVRRFEGSLAIARYEIRSRSAQFPIRVLREHVRTIDHDVRLDPRPPFHRRILLQDGLASDIQAFGYVGPGVSPQASPSPWYFFRQDLYLDSGREPFLIIHWKHELSSIRMLDMIPGEGTTLVSER